MFAEAYHRASKFTRPLVISRQNAAGECDSSIGTFVVLNREGWFLTAWHIVEAISQMNDSAAKLKRYESDRQLILNDSGLSKVERKRRIAALGLMDPKKTTRRLSTFWGFNGVTVLDGTGIPEIDLAVGRLDPFDPAWVEEYPKIKDPTKGMTPGVSLCKLGFPFHAIEPTWDEAANSFRLPAGALPLPFFPMEGIFTREVIVPHRGDRQPGFPLKYLETSSPGLRGQSGGPTFDRDGVVWAIQSRTQHLSLGFDPPVPGRAREREHQFLNVGWGVHADTIVGYLRDLKVSFELSDH